MPVILKRPRAADDLIELWGYIADDNVARADAFIDDVDAKLNLLAEQPMLGRSREEALDPRGTVLGSLAFEAVRQEQHEAAGLPPLVLRGDEVLVEDDLRAVDEVAELRFPRDERFSVRDRVPVLEPERGVLR